MFNAHGQDGRYHAFYKTIPLSLAQFREVNTSGAVGNNAANGGVLSSETTPILGAEATSEAMALIWAAGNADIVQVQVPLPDDFDGREPMVVDFEVLTDNSGGGGIEAATMNLLASFDNGAQVTDQAVDSDPATTVHTVTATIAAEDIPNDARFVNFQIFPGTHANDPVHLLSVRPKYLPRTTAFN